MDFPDFISLTPALRSGVYILVNRGRVVYIAGARKCVLDRVAKHRELAFNGAPFWLPLPPIRYDEVHFRPCAPHEIDALVESLREAYLPEARHESAA